MSQEIQERWRGFVQKITGRLSEVTSESDAGFAGLLQDPELDPITFVNAMNAIELRYKDLYAKLSTTYSEQIVTPLLGRSGEAEKLLHDAERWMEDTFQRFRTGWNLKLVQSLWARVGPSMQRPVPCTRCGATLGNRTVFHQAESLVCPHCKALNSVTPDPLVYTYFAMAPDMVADAQTIGQRLAVEREAARAGKGRKIELWTAYWEAYASARATIVPMDEAERRGFVDSRVEPIRRYG